LAADTIALKPGALATGAADAGAEGGASFVAVAQAARAKARGRAAKRWS
jgi:hypothetical protein